MSLLALAVRVAVAAVASAAAFTALSRLSPRSPRISRRRAAALAVGGLAVGGGADAVLSGVPIAGLVAAPGAWIGIVAALTSADRRDAVVFGGVGWALSTVTIGVPLV